MGDFYQSSLGSSDFADPKNASAHQRCILLSEDLHIYIYIYIYMSCHFIWSALRITQVRALKHRQLFYTISPIYAVVGHGVKGQHEGEPQLQEPDHQAEGRHIVASKWMASNIAIQVQLSWRRWGGRVDCTITFMTSEPCHATSFGVPYGSHR